MHANDEHEYTLIYTLKNSVKRRWKKKSISEIFALKEYQIIRKIS